jgi:serpin B
MSRYKLAVWTGILLVFLVGADTIQAENESSGDSTAMMHQVTRSGNAFGLRLFRKTVSDQPEGSNVAVSPVSLYAALTMTYNGGAGTTKDAMASTLGLASLRQMELNRGSRHMREYLENLDSDVVFSSAQSVWIDEGLATNPDFRDLSEQFFDADVNNLKFSDPTSVDAINQWIAAHTKAKVRSILDYIPRDALVYLVNAVRFAGRWKYPFEPEMTHEAAFTKADGSRVPCQLMTSRTLRLPYLKDQELDVQLADLPYGDSNFVMTVMLPDPEKDVNDLVASLDAVNWDNLTGRLQTAAIKVRLPKLALDADYELSAVLADLGMDIAFDPNRADFSAMIDSASGHVFISRVLHKTVITIDEKGTEAGAGTVVEISKGPGIIDLTVDRPFLFAIREVSSGSILFLAKVIDPTSIPM